MGYKRKSGFTFIEIIIVVAVVGISLPAIFTIIFNLLRLNLQLGQLQRIKEVGDFVSNSMITTVRRSAFRIDPSCATEVLQGVVSDPQVSESILFRDRSDVCFGYYLKSVENSGVTTVTFASASAAFDPDQMEDYSTTLVVNDQSEDYPLTVSNLELTAINSHLARVYFKLISNPTVPYLKPQELIYQFYIYIRN